MFEERDLEIEEMPPSKIAPIELDKVEGGYIIPKEGDHLLEVQQRLEREGLSEEWEARTPAANQLFLDLDTNESLGLFIKQFDILKETWPRATYELTTSKSGNRHAIVYFPYVVDEKWKIALQAALGSDPKRELLHLVSLWNGWKNPVILVERKSK